MRDLLAAILLAMIASALFVLPKPSAADKMRPGYKNYIFAHGLNANNNCRRPHFNICQNCNVVIPMRVAQDRQCGFNFQTLGPFSGQEILVRPTNGTYNSINETTSVYRPNQGFTGHDHFESRLYFEEAGGKRTFLVLKVNVFVTPNLSSQQPAALPKG